MTGGRILIGLIVAGLAVAVVGIVATALVELPFPFALFVSGVVVAIAAGLVGEVLYG